MLLVILLGAVSTGIAPTASARESIIAGIRSNHEAIVNGKIFSADDLLKDADGTRYFSGHPDATWDEGAYIEIDVKPGMLSPDSPDHLVVYVRRPEATPSGEHSFEDASPTTFRVVGLFGADDSDDVDNWHELFYTYLLYRGPNTKEYSCRVSIKKLWKMASQNPWEYNPDNMADDPATLGKSLKKMRFYVTANHNRDYDPETQFRGMAMRCFDVYKISPDEHYSPSLIDRFHLTTDYFTAYGDYDFIHNRGIVDAPNKVNGWDEVTEAEQQTLYANGIGTTVPKYDMITPESSNYPLNPGEKRQQTHTVEHILYAIPGDAIALYPYYELWTTNWGQHYETKFSHWYDYRSGGPLRYHAPWSHYDYDLLDCLIDPEMWHKTENDGFYGGQYMNSTAANEEITTVQQYIEAVNEINRTGGSGYIKIGADLDFTGRNDIPMLGSNMSTAFGGVFDGGGFTITGLRYEMGQEGVGLIGWTKDGAVVQNVTLSNTCYFQGSHNVGGIVGRHRSGALTIRNIRTEATVRGNNWGEQAAGGVLGMCSNQGPNRLILEDVYVGGTVGYVSDNASQPQQRNAGLIAWWEVRNNPYDLNLKNVVVKCEVLGSFDSAPNDKNRRYIRNYSSNETPVVEGNRIRRGKITYENCYGNQEADKDDVCWTYMATEAEMPPLFEGWSAGWVPPVKESSGWEIMGIGGSNVVGSYATFFCPRNPYIEAGKQEALPFHLVYNDDTANEFIIAADFSQEFTPGKNIDNDKKEIYEPLIAFRHIFRIRDGREFAEMLSGSVDNNVDFVRRNQKIVTARANDQFQIRLDSPIPVDNTTRSKYYYKISDQEYRRVCGMDIRVLDGATRQELGNYGTNNRFYLSDTFQGRGLREIDGIEYTLCGGEERYYRMLHCDSPTAGNYIVQLIGKDINNDRIKIIDSQEDLVVMEYNITFLPETAAAMLQEEELYRIDKFKHMRPEEMEKRLGEPKYVINFDELSEINNLTDEALKSKLLGQRGVSDPGVLPAEETGLKAQYYKWPVEWTSCNYGFMYNNVHDYNMYEIVSHSSMTPWHLAVDQWDNEKVAAGEPKGLFDRKYYDSLRLKKDNPEQPVEQGFYYYVNAASDPGVMQRLEMTELCQGATINVSAWLAEFSTNSEVANLSFNFVAVLKDNIGDAETAVLKGGDRVTLHSFITGYVPKAGGHTSSGETKDSRGKWLYVNYSFVPQLSEFSTSGITPEMVDHYEIELDNNAKSSAGADYAVDDIRVYITSPVVYAYQHEPVCEQTETPIKIEAPFNSLIQSMGLQEVTGNTPGEQVSLYYTFVDKDKFDKIYDGGSNGAEAFEASVVRYDYDVNDGQERMYGKVTFSTNYNATPEYYYNKENPVTGVGMRDTNPGDGERVIVFDSELSDKNLHPGKEYYVVLRNSFGEGDVPGESAQEVWEYFQMLDRCAKVRSLTIESTNLIKVDGELAPTNDLYTVCENQSPVIQININGMRPDGSTEVIAYNAFFDWFNGTMDDFRAYTSEGGSLEEALKVLREYYPDAELNEVNEITLPDAKAPALEQWMKDIIVKAASADEDGVVKLTLHTSSFVYDPLNLEEGETESEGRVVAIPIPIDVDEDFIICVIPTEVRVRVRNKAPLLLHGLTGIPYPVTMSDVPLRIGLDQVHLASGKSGAYGSDGVVIPIRTVESSDGKIREMSLKGEGTIILVQTDDPEYKDLGTINGDGEETYTLLDVGEVVEDKFNAQIGADDNKFVAVFDDDFKFKEGYYYRLRFQYQESYDEDELPEDDDRVICDGQDVFTLKIVPRFLQWTGDESLNWNDDSNWVRVHSDELATSDERRRGEYAEYVIDGVNPDGKRVNARRKGFAPLEFTSVIIPGTVEGPYMYASAMSEVGEFDNWPSQPSVPSVTYNNMPDEATLGSVTPGVKYEMVAYPRVDKVTDGNIYCRPWYMNTCRDIHFKSSAAIMNQHEMVYDKAWVDMELNHSRWYTVSSPLKEVYSGDFYLPSDNARQESELFEPILFDNTLAENDRFKPAVFQRGWDKGAATVYEFPGTQRDVALKTTWSHVYNDMNEAFGGGAGFSIKTDISRMDGDKPGEDETVMFRLPKADTLFKYYTSDGRTNPAHDLTVSRENTNRLNDVGGTIKAVSMGSSSLFLVGNPFMTDLDISKFINVNVAKGLIKRNFRIITATGQEAGVIIPQEEGTSVIKVAPFQGFFVEAVNPTENLELEYDESMMVRRRKESSDGMLKIKTRGEETSDTFRVVASAENGVTTSAEVVRGIGLDNAEYGVMALDSRSLDIPSIVYTVGDEKALSINFADDVNGMEVGVIADEGTETMLSFEGVEMADGLYLHDLQDDSYTPVVEGMTYIVAGPASGRLYLTDYAPLEKTTNLQWMRNGNTITVRDLAQTGRITVRVYDALGRLMKVISEDCDEVSVTLDGGFYLIEAQTESDRSVTKQLF